MKKYLFLIIPFLVLASCSKPNHFTLKGSIGPSEQKTIYISRVKVDEVVVADSAKIDRRGLFRFRIKAMETDFYQVGTSPDNFITLLAGPGEKIYLRSPDENLAENYTVEGSEGSEQIRLLDIRLLKTKKSLDSITDLYRKAETETDFETKGKSLEDEYVKLLKDQRRFNIEFILRHMRSLSSIKALYQKVDDDTYVLYESRDLQYLKIVADSLQKYYPRSNHTKALVADLSREMNQFYARQLEQLSSSLPETKLDPDLMDLTGKRISLSSLRGKYVLLTFWSVESRECIAENLQFKEFYKTYNRKGFEIYQVNLDQDEDAWRNAVRFDELPWISTREDDPSNPQLARLYNVRSLPANYLYDPEGTIVARDIHGRTLQLKLSQLFNTR